MEMLGESPRVEGGIPAFSPRPLPPSRRTLQTDIPAQLKASCSTSCPCFPPTPHSALCSPGTHARMGFCFP